MIANTTAAKMRFPVFFIENSHPSRATNSLVTTESRHPQHRLAYENTAIQRVHMHPTDVWELSREFDLPFPTPPSLFQRRHSHDANRGSPNPTIVEDNTRAGARLQAAARLFQTLMTAYKRLPHRKCQGCTILTNWPLPYRLYFPMMDTQIIAGTTMIRSGAR